MLDGNIIGGDTVKKTRITDTFLQVVCDYNIINQYDYDKLYIFCDKNLIGLPHVLKEINQYKVIDILRAKSLVASCGHKTIKTRTDESLVKELHIIKENSTSPIEIYSISFLTKEQLLDFDFSDPMVKFKSEHILEENGSLGKSIGVNSRSAIELEIVERIVRKEMDRYKETENIKFIYGN